MLIKEKKRIYMDNAGTTQVDTEVLETIKNQYLTPDLEARFVIEAAKKTIATVVGVLPHEIAFTASGSAANNMAICHHAYSQVNKGKHLLVSATEHPSVLSVFKKLSGEGFDVEIIPVNSGGQVSVDDIMGRIRTTTTLVAVMYYNNEVGTKQPVEALGELLLAKGIAFHVDAVQALGKTPFQLKASSMAFSAHKIHGPKGCGALYMSSGIPFDPCMFSNDAPSIAGFDVAVQMAYQNLSHNLERLKALKARLIEGLLRIDPAIQVVGALEDAQPCIVNVNFPSRDGDGLVIQYDWEGVAVSSGSACSSGAMSASPVLMAMGMSEAQAKRSVRFSTSIFTTAADIDAVLQATERILKR